MKEIEIIDPKDEREAARLGWHIVRACPPSEIKGRVFVMYRILGNAQLIEYRQYCGCERCRRVRELSAVHVLEKAATPF